MVSVDNDSANSAIVRPRKRMKPGATAPPQASGPSTRDAIDRRRRIVGILASTSKRSGPRIASTFSPQLLQPRIVSARPLRYGVRHRFESGGTLRGTRKRTHVKLGGLEVRP